MRRRPVPAHEVCCLKQRVATVDSGGMAPDKFTGIVPERRGAGRPEPWWQRIRGHQSLTDWLQEGYEVGATELAMWEDPYSTTWELVWSHQDHGEPITIEDECVVESAAAEALLAAWPPQLRGNLLRHSEGRAYIGSFEPGS